LVEPFSLYCLIIFEKIVHLGYNHSLIALKGERFLEVLVGLPLQVNWKPHCFLVDVLIATVFEFVVFAVMYLLKAMVMYYWKMGILSGHRERHKSEVRLHYVLAYNQSLS
jgi:hypothetical protein